MYAMRQWSARHARGLKQAYEKLEYGLFKLYPWMQRVGVDKLEKPLMKFVEQPTKRFLFDSQSCGQCTLGSTGMSCPMNCPKTIRNGPCGGVRANGKCEVKPDMDCVWVVAWQGTQQLKPEDQAIQIMQPMLDWRLKGKSAWLRAVEQRVREIKS